MRAARDGDRLLIEIGDDGAGARSGFREGVGLGNTRARLVHLYPGAHSLRIENGPGGGFQVAMEVPFRT